MRATNVIFLKNSELDQNLLKKTLYPLLLYTDDGKYGFIPVPKNKVVGIYKELHRVITQCKIWKI